MNLFNTNRSNEARLFFSLKEKQAIEEAIISAEKNTSGEIRLHLENHIKKTALNDAQEIFEKIGMTNTDARNGVLILLAIQDKQFAVIGDSGINTKVEENFWHDITKIMAHYFEKNDFSSGLIKGIAKIGEKLSIHFPCKEDDINELPNVISYSK